jgi:hypothetical protein
MSRCTCRPYARCLECIERDGLTAGKRDDRTESVGSSAEASPPRLSSERQAQGAALLEFSRRLGE